MKRKTQIRRFIWAGKRGRWCGWIRGTKLWRILLVCTLLAFSLFVVYKAIEQTWFADIDPQLLRPLHIVSGLSAAVIAAVTASILWLRPKVPPARDEAHPESTGTWKRRLQHVGLRTKIVVPIVTLAVVPLVVLGVFSVLWTRQMFWDSAHVRLEIDIDSKARSVRQFLDGVQQDLIFLGRLGAVRELAGAEAVDTPGRIEAFRHRVEQEFLLFTQGKREYYQVRYLSETGREVVRLNVDEGSPRIVPPRKLQEKTGRYYVREALLLEPGKVYVSPMDFNVERGERDEPPRAVVRYATRVLDSEGSPRGLVVINVYADYILALLSPVTGQQEARLVDTEGAYLGYLGESERNNAAYSLGSGRSLSDDFTGEVSQTILSADAGTRTVDTAAALFVSAPIRFDAANVDRWWTLVMSYPRDSVEGPIRRLTAFLSVILVLAIVASGLCGVLIGDYFVQPIMSLRAATREVAQGNLLTRVKITTGDEIEGLAFDFNVMIGRLSRAQEQLSSWNEDLVREVESQTEKLHNLQAGLAKADKLAAVGQMTAAVMHEVNNPLTAIKTKIQVAQEREGLAPPSADLLPSILREVDRLAEFIRSFSHLGGLAEPRFEPVLLGEVFQEVSTLIGPDIKRRRLTLHVEVSPDVPSVSGDGGKLRQLLINLILNAADASPEQSIISVRTHAIDDGSQGSGKGCLVGIEVADRGTGMSPEVVAKIWEPFFTTKTDGTGLGLAICKRIVEQHQGTIDLRSREGEGTTVMITLPALSDGLTSDEKIEQPVHDDANTGDNL